MCSSHQMCVISFTHILCSFSFAPFEHLRIDSILQWDQKLAIKRKKTCGTLSQMEHEIKMLCSPKNKLVLMTTRWPASVLTSDSHNPHLKNWKSYTSVNTSLLLKFKSIQRLFFFPFFFRKTGMFCRGCDLLLFIAHFTASPRYVWPK